jgi:hypothetical protein
MPMFRRKPVIIGASGRLDHQEGAEDFVVCRRDAFAAN